MWIPPGELRDKRELPRTRMVLVRERTKLKQRIHATLAKYGIHVGASDLFGVKGLRGGNFCLKISSFFRPTPAT